ncbi:flippase-like domain-containing protein [bacterium]|nr:flippase-like domain-containing protein [bacterium]
MLKFKVWRFLGVVIFVYILYKIDWPQMTSVLKRINLQWIIIAALINIPHLWLKSTRWQFLLAVQNKTIRNREAFLLYMSSLYLGVVTPGRLGEFAKAIYLRQAGITTISHGFSSVLVDRLFDLYLLFLLAMAGLVFLTPWPGSDAFGWAGFAGAVIVPLIFLFSGRTEQLISLLYKKVLASKLLKFAKEGGEQFGQGMRELMTCRIYRAGLLTLVAWLLFFFQCFLIAKALELPITYMEIILVMAITNIFTFLPISISGLGTREAALCFLLLPRGISLELILAYSMGVLVVFFVAGGLMGAVAWCMRPLGLENLKGSRK